MHQTKRFLVIIGILFTGILSPLRAQLSDSLFAMITETLKPSNPNRLSVEEKRTVLSYAHDFAWRAGSGLIAELDNLAEELSREAEIVRDRQTKALNYFALGNYYTFFKSTEGPKAIWVAYYDSVLKYASGIPQLKKQTAYSNLGIGIYRVQQSKFEEAAENFRFALETFTDLKDTSGISRTHAYLYPLYSSLNLFQSAIEEQNLMLKYMTVSERATGLADFYKAENNQDRALVYLAWFEASGYPALMDSAELYMNKSATQIRNSDRLLSFDFFLRGYRYLLKKQYREALNAIDSSLKTPDFYPETSAGKMAYKGICLLKLGKRKEGAEFLLAAPGIRSDYHLAADMYNALYQDALDNKEYQKAVEYLRLNKLYSDSAAVIIQRGQVFEVMQKHSVAKKEIEIKDLELINAERSAQRNSLILFSVILVIALLAVIIWLYGRGRDRKIKAMEAREELDKEKRNFEDIIRLHEREMQRQGKRAILNLRKKISRDMHDELSSALAGLKYYVSDLRSREQKGEVKQLLGSVEQEVESVYAQARSYMHNLHKGIEEAVGNLGSFLQQVSTGLSQKNGLNVQLKYNKTEIESRLSHTQQNQLTLTLKEAISNILKHSGASVAEIEISFKNNICYFLVSDNGRGFEKNNHDSGLGMESIRLRIKRIKGNISIHTSPNGTRLEGQFPLE